MERKLDLSRWLRTRLKARLASDEHAFSFVVPDGLELDLRDEQRACALLDQVLDLVLEHEPASHAALLEVTRSSAPDERHVVLRLTREGGAAVPEEATDGAEALAREARRIGGDLMLGNVSAHSVTAVVKLATR